MSANVFFGNSLSNFNSSVIGESYSLFFCKFSKKGVKFIFSSFFVAIPLKQYKFLPQKNQNQMITERSLLLLQHSFSRKKNISLCQ